jgi:small subunit ribosomal protein S6
MLLIDPRREDAEIEQTLTAFANLITERGGEVANWDRWGRRKLAYELEDLTEGYYAICTYNVESTLRGEIESALPFVEGIVRAKTVRRDVRTRGTK